jgi:hypothetical protein
LSLPDNNCRMVLTWLVQCCRLLAYRMVIVLGLFHPVVWLGFSFPLLCGSCGPMNRCAENAPGLFPCYVCSCMKDNVALIAVLEMAEQQSGAKQLLCVANTHIHANPELNDVKLWQVHTLLKGLEKIANR